MSTYAFESMSPGQATSFAVGDNLILTSRLATSTNVSVTFTGADVTITSEGRSLTFGAAFTERVHSIRPSGENLIVIGSRGDDVITGLSRSGLQSVDGDVLFGGAGNDTLDGDLGADTLNGGAGADMFIVRNGGGDVITDFSADDRLFFIASAISAGQYVEGTAATDSAAASFANAEVLAGRAKIVAVQVGADVQVLVSTTILPGSLSNGLTRTILKGTSLDKIDFSQLSFGASYTGAAPPAAPPPVDTASPEILPTTAAPRAPGPLAIQPAVGATGTITGDIDLLHFGDLKDTQFTEINDARFRLAEPGINFLLEGSVLAYDTHQVLIDGVINYVSFRNTAGAEVALNTSMGNGIRGTAYGYWVANDANTEAFGTLLRGSDTITGSAGADRIRTFDGPDLVSGGGGGDTIFGGGGSDVIRAGDTATAGTGSTYLRGDDGNDWIQGGSGFDDINGNAGWDVGTGGDGDDWVVGGKDPDLLFGDAGNDLVYGNLGTDTCDGGAGDDIVRGGQDNDVVRGWSGADFLSGDKGDDTVTGGSGADLFHFFEGAGMDRVTDFHIGEGDRVQLAPGTRYTVAQVGPDVVITTATGDQMVLEGVYLTTLGNGWIFGA